MAAISFGLIGYPLGHSFSKQYYDGKIQRERLDNVNYHLFPMPELDGAFPDLFVERSELRGVNVTIPHKISVMRFLDEISEEAQAIGAVNCVVRKSDGRLKGHNTDAFGFEQSLRPLLGASKAGLSALVLGNGGAARAVTYVLGKLGIAHQVVSRQFTSQNTLTYADLDVGMIEQHSLLINTTPLGMYPHVDQAPPLPYEALNSKHLLYDLIYNPEQTLFMREGLNRGARVKNGYEMLLLQAERNWELWMEHLL